MADIWSADKPQWTDFVPPTRGETKVFLSGHTSCQKLQLPIGTIETILPWTNLQWPGKIRPTVIVSSLMVGRGGWNLENTRYVEKRYSQSRYLLIFHVLLVATLDRQKELHIQTTIHNRLHLGRH